MLFPLVDLEIIAEIPNFAIPADSSVSVPANLLEEVLVVLAVDLGYGSGDLDLGPLGE